LTHKTSSNNQILARGHTSVFSPHRPFPRTSVELRANDNRLERTVLLNIQHLVDMIEVGSELFIVGIVGRPCPVSVYLRPGVLVFGYFGVDTGTGVPRVQLFKVMETEIQRGCIPVPAPSPT
jgi:hypothetical protein